jgi:allophanate hydrolase subunit 1
MTKVQLEYELHRPLTDADEKAIRDVHSQYGMQRVQLAPSLDKLCVEYDASRLTEQDVEATLARLGLPIKSHWIVP